jgi:putative phosphoribosyl transferase
MVDAGVNIYRRVSGPFPAFEDRYDAGLKLVEALHCGRRPNSFVLALPRGGVPVAAALADHLEAPLDLALVRKLPLPSSPEAGFGAVAIDGTRILNTRMVRHFHLSDSEIDSISEQVRKEVQRRAREYRGAASPPEIRGMDVYLVDDGLATGYSMMAAAMMVRKLQPNSITLCVPVSPDDSIAVVTPHFDVIHCLIAQDFPPFAVASFYKRFPDMSDEEVREILIRRGSTPAA